MANLETYGDLKTLINNINKRQKGDKIISKGKEFALDQVLGLIPGASNAKTAFDFIKTAILKPDTKKTNTWLDKLDIDDDMSKIIDDTVENGFMQAMASSIEAEPNTKTLEDNFNMNAKMVDYLKNTYKGRTVTGIQEATMKKSELKKLIKEQILEVTAEDPTLQGQIKIDLFKKLGIEGFDPSKFTTTINLVKNNKSLNIAANKILADVMVALLKADDPTLLAIFNNLKQFKTK
jgi:uncharacterized protein (UPF0335 family)